MSWSAGLILCLGLLIGFVALLLAWPKRRRPGSLPPPQPDSRSNFYRDWKTK